MRRLELDFIAPPRRSPWPGLAVLIVSLVTASILGTSFQNIREELGRLQTASGLVNTERRPVRIVPKERLEEERKQLEQIVRQLTLPWASLVETMEDTSTSDVAILQLQPDAQQYLLRLTAEAKHQEAMLEYLRRLVAANTLTNVHVVNHQVQLDDPQHPIQFAVQASFKRLP